MLTGVGSMRTPGRGQLCADDGRYPSASRPAVAGYYHGTGDVFASVVTSLACGLASRAVEMAGNFTAASIRRTRDAGTDLRFGVNFEMGLTALAAEMNLLQPSD